MDLIYIFNDNDADNGRNIRSDSDFQNDNSVDSKKMIDSDIKDYCFTITVLLMFSIEEKKIPRAWWINLPELEN